MPRYLMSFDDDAMNLSAEELPEADEAAHAVIREAQAAGVWIFGGGLNYGEPTSLVDTDGSVTDGPQRAKKDRIGGFSIIDVPTREEALKWAAKIAAACRCAQEVREILHDPAV